MTEPKQLARTCLACGTTKPIAAFLQITGAQGTIYGNTCSECRGRKLKAKLKIEIDDTDDGSSSSGVKINTKNKVYAEIQQKLQDKQQKELNLDLNKKIEKSIFDKITRKEQIEKSEKDHRTNYIDAKKNQSFLSFQNKTPSSNTASTIRNSQEKSFWSNQQNNTDTIQLETAIKQETNTKSIDTTQLYVDTQCGELKFQGEIFKRFKALLGNSSNFRTVERLYGKLQSVSADSPLPTHPSRKR